MQSRYLEVFTFHSGYILIYIIYEEFSSFTSFTFHSGYILIRLLCTGNGLPTNLYILFWLYSNKTDPPQDAYLYDTLHSILVIF